MFKNHNAKKINNNEKIKHFNFIYTSVGHSKNHGSKPALNQHKYFINCSGINTYYFMLSNAYSRAGNPDDKCQDGRDSNADALVSILIS